MPRLLLLNGAPGVGKSTAAARWATSPLTLVVEVDALRTSLTGWRDEVQGASQSTARALALALVEAHLRAGHDVVVPQYVGRVEFVEALDAVAGATGSTFIEVVLTDDTDAIIERFRDRRRAGGDDAHPAAEVADGDVRAVVLDAVDRLARLAETRPATRYVPVGAASH